MIKQRKWYSRRVFRYALIAVAVYLIHSFGVFTHFFELNFERHFNYPMEKDELVRRYAQQVRSKSQVEVAPINEYNYSFIHRPIKCQTDAVPRLTLLIKSALGNVEKRAVIRRTWAYEQRFSDKLIKRVFVLGIGTDSEQMLQIKEEALANNDDIVQADFVDAYFNNTIKTMIGMRWAVESCAHSEYYMFVDDDYYVSLKNTLRFLTDSKPITSELPKDHDTKLFAGFVFQTAPHRHKWSKWYVPLSEYPFDMWPPYVTAGAFILSREALQELYHVSMYTRHFRFDDVYLGIVALKANIMLSHNDQFYFHRPRYNGPKSYRQVIASHGFDEPEELERIWNECRSAGFA